MPTPKKKLTSGNRSVTSHTVTRTEWIDSRVEMSRRIKYVQMHFSHVSAISLIVLIPVIVSRKFLRVLALLSKMPARCIVAGCSNTSKYSVSLHVFPKDDNHRRIWTSKVKVLLPLTCYSLTISQNAVIIENGKKCLHNYERQIYLSYYTAS